MIYLVDIDGTIADCSHRIDYIRCNPKYGTPDKFIPNWRKFFAECVNDTPIQSVIDTVNLLHDAGASIILMSGRSDEVRGETYEWCMKHGVKFDALYMRASGDHRPDNITKAGLLRQVIADNPTDSIVGVFDDRQQVVDMYREKGYKVFQVAKGDF